MLKNLKNMKQKFDGRFKIILAVLAVALVPALPSEIFQSARAFSPATKISAPAATISTLDVKLKSTGADLFSGDKNVLSAKKIPFDSSAPQFQNIYRIKIAESPSAFENKYAWDIVYSQPEQKLKAGFTSVNDPGFSTDPTNTDRQWGLLKADFPDAWDKTKGSSSVVVAVIDTGIDGTHEDLSAGQVGPGFDFLNHTFIPLNSNSDDNGHGTLVAGVIAATANNFRGIVGTDWYVTLMPLKALDSSGSGNSADVAAAIVWAADHGANIINMSLGGVGFGNDTTLSDAITYAYNKNVVMVAAAGNDVAVTGGDLDVNPVFPVCDDNGQNMIIGVAATDVNDQKASFSNYGKACVDVSAPGQRILSTINYDPITHAKDPNAYAYASGTSLAAPFVSGEAALIKALYPAENNKQIEDRIIKSADPIDNLNATQCEGESCAGMLGSGRINAYKALDPNLFPNNLKDGELVQPDNSSQIYLISGGQKDPVSPFVLQERFPGVTPIIVPAYTLDGYPTGSYALPADGTIVKSADNNTVYEILGGFKRPITYQIFLQRAIMPAQINIVSDIELSSWVTGTFLPPVEGTLVRTSDNQTVYWVVDGLLHPIDYGFYIQRGLNIFPIMIMSDNDLGGYSKGNAYIR